MPDIDTELAAALRQAKSKPMFFALVAKGSEGKLLVDKKKISAKEAADAKKECGGGTVYKGRCVGDDGTLVFEVGKEVPATLATLTKKLIKKEAGLTLDVEYRLAADLADEDKETEGEDAEVPTAAPPAPPPPPPKAAAPAAPPQPAPGGAEVTKRLNAMTGDLKAALVGPQKARVQTLFGTVNGLIKNKDFVQAGKVLDELEPLVRASAVPRAPSSAPPPVGADVTKRLNAMTGSIKMALAGPDKARVQTLVGSANSLIKNKDFVQAGKVLDELEPLLKRAAAAPDGPDAGNPQAEWERRIMAIEPKILEAQKKRAGEAKWMTMFMSAQDTGSEGDFAKALQILDRLEALLNAGPAPSSPELTAALQKWTAARTAAVDQLRKVVAAFKAARDPQADQGAVLLEAIINNLTPRPGTRKQVNELVRYLETDDIIPAAESPNPFGFTVSIRTPLLNVLAELKSLAV